jgi:hypothetical protein
MLLKHEAACVLETANCYEMDRHCRCRASKTNLSVGRLDSFLIASTWANDVTESVY